MGKPSPGEERSLDQSQLPSPEPQWWVCRSTMPSCALSKPAPISTWGPAYTPGHRLPHTGSRPMGAALSQAAGHSPCPQTRTHTNRLDQRTPDPAMSQGPQQHSVGPLPPHHSEGQPHGPGVVDDVSSHLGLQEGALSQAPVLVNRDLLAPPGKEISQPQRTPTPTSFPSAGISFPAHMTIMWQGDPAGSERNQRQNEELRALMATTGRNSRLRKSGTPSEGMWLKSQEDTPQRDPCSPRLSISWPTGVASSLRHRPGCPLASSPSLGPATYVLCDLEKVTALL